jgi:hypothetical protein
VADLERADVGATDMAEIPPFLFCSVKRGSPDSERMLGMCASAPTQMHHL